MARRRGQEITRQDGSREVLYGIRWPKKGMVAKLAESPIR